MYWQLARSVLRLTVIRIAIQKNKMSLGLCMIRTIIVVAVSFLLISSVARSEGREYDNFDLGIRPNELGIQPRHSHRFKMDVSPQKYEETYDYNREYTHKMLSSYSDNMLKMVGIPKRGRQMMGTALGVVINNGLALDLDKNDTYALEFRGVDNSERALFFRIKVDW